MNEAVRKEINTLKSEISGKGCALEADKLAFMNRLKRGMGQEIIDTLNNPPKPKFTTGLKIKYARWKRDRRERKNKK